MTADDFDPERLLATLVEHDVLFVVIGGLGRQHPWHARRHATTSMCATPVIERTSSGWLPSWARSMPPLRGPERKASSRSRWTRRRSPSATGSPFGPTHGPFDILGTPSGTRGYDDLAADATRFEIADGIVIMVASVSDLMRMKRASARTKDIAQLAHLEALEEEIGRTTRRRVGPTAGDVSAATRQVDHVRSRW